MRYLLIASLLLGGLVFAQAPDDNTLVIAQTRTVTSLDPTSIGDTATFNILRGIVFVTLTEITNDGEIIPFLADSWTVSEDGTEISFNIHPGLTCADGEPLTAEDVVYTFQRAANPANAFTGNTNNFVFPNVGYVDARVDGELVATIITRNYNPDAVGLLSAVMIHCKDSYEAMSLDEAASNPIASGPYEVVEYLRGDRVTVRQREGYDLRRGPFDTLVWRTIPEASTQAAELIAGNVDIAAGVVPDQRAAIDGSGSATVKSIITVRRIAMWYSFNEKVRQSSAGAQAVQAAEVRRALQYAIDVPTICSSLLGVECERMTTLVNPPNDNPNLEPYPYDPEMAERLLDEAGYPRDANGVRFTLELQTPNGQYQNDVNVSLAVAQYLTDIGVTTNVTPMETASVFSPLYRAHEAGPLFLNGTGGGTWSAIRDMGLYASYEANNNYNDWNNPEWFALFAQMSQERDREARQLIVNRMLEVFYNDPPWLLLYFNPAYFGVSDRIVWEPRRDEVIDVFEIGLANR